MPERMVSDRPMNRRVDMSKPQPNEKGQSDGKGRPGGGSGSKSSLGKSGPKKGFMEAEKGSSDPGAKGSQKEREAERKGQNAPGGVKRRSDKKT